MLTGYHVLHRPTHALHLLPCFRREDLNVHIDHFPLRVPAKLGHHVVDYSITYPGTVMGFRDFGQIHSVTGCLVRDRQPKGEHDRV